MRTDANAGDCTRGCTDTARESTLKVDSGRKISRRTGESNLRRRRACRSDALPTEPYPQLTCSAVDGKLQGETGRRGGGVRVELDKESGARRLHAGEGTRTTEGADKLTYRVVGAVVHLQTVTSFRGHR